MKLLIILSLSLLINCQSTPEATTARMQERSEYVTTGLDNAANDCLTDACKKAMKEAKELIKDSLDVMVDKDHAIQVKQKQIDNEAFYTKIGRFVFWSGVVLIVGFLIYVFRDQLITLIKIVKPI